MKKLLGILVLGLLLTGCATTESLVSSGKFKKDMSKSDFKDVFLSSYPSDTPLYPDGGSEFFASSGNEIVWAPNRKQFFVFKNVSEQKSCGIVLCKVGNGTLESWHISLNDARDAIKSKTKTETETKKISKTIKKKTVNKIENKTTTTNNDQAERKKLIDELISTHYIFEKIEIPGSLPRVWVTRKFYLLTFSEKKTFMHLVYSYYYTKNPKYDVIRIFDNITGKSIGSYKPDTGLRIK